MQSHCLPGEEPARPGPGHPATSRHWSRPRASNPPGKADGSCSDSIASAEHKARGAIAPGVSGGRGQTGHWPVKPTRDAHRSLPAAHPGPCSKLQPPTPEAGALCPASLPSRSLPWPFLPARVELAACAPGGLWVAGLPLPNPSPTCRGRVANPGAGNSSSEGTPVATPERKAAAPARTACMGAASRSTATSNPPAGTCRGRPEPGQPAGPSPQARVGKSLSHAEPNYKTKSHGATPCTRLP